MNAPRLAYVGNFEPEYSTENDVRAAFTHMGWDVDPLQENKITPDQLLRAAREADLLLWTSTWDDAVELSAAQYVFDDCRARGVPTATYHLDVFHGVARGGRNWRANPMMHTDFVCTADGDHEEEFKRDGINHVWLRPGVRHTACHPGTARKQYICDVAFVGSDGHNYHPEWRYRRDLVDWLEHTCDRHGWSFRNPGGREEKVQRSEDMNDFYASVKVTVGDSLCLYREEARYWSDRAYEAPGRGGFLIMPRITALDEDYHGTLPMYGWDDWDELEWLIGRYIERADIRARIKRATWDIVCSDHTYVRRMQELLKVVGL